MPGMLIATLIAVCLLVFLIAVLWPRGSVKAERAGTAPLRLGSHAAGKAPGRLGRWLRKPFNKGQRAVHGSGRAGRRVHEKLD
jgi:hypothetical protein